MLNYWNATWSLDAKQCPCDLHFVDYLERSGAENAAIFHMGTGSHHIVGLKMAAGGKGNHVLAVTASPEEYEAYVRLAIENPRLGFTYKAYFGDIYQIDAKLLPKLDHVTLFHLGEYRTEANDSYGGLSDLEMARVLVSRLKPDGLLHLYTGSFAYDKADAVARTLSGEGLLAEYGGHETLRMLVRR